MVTAIEDPTSAGPTGSETAPAAPLAQKNAEAEATARAHAGLEAVREIAEPLAAAHGVTLVDVEWTTVRGGRVLRVTIDRAEMVDGGDEGGDAASDPEDRASSAIAVVEGVTLDDCVRLSRDLSTALDVEDVLSVRYTLEVSSPGLDRPLRSARDFRRQRGRLAKVKLRQPAADGQRVLRGRLLEVSDTSFSMDVDGNVHDVQLEDVEEAKLVFELGGAKKPNQKKAAPRRKKSKGSRR